MREGRWRWWRDQGSQRKRSLHAWMRWDKHSDILSRAMCARNECDSKDRTRTKKTKTTTRTFTCSPSVSRHCRVSCALCWSWFSRCHWCRTSHRWARRFHTSTSFHHAYAIPSAKFFSSGCCSPTLSCHRQLNLYFQILAYFTSRKRVFWGVFFTDWKMASRTKRSLEESSSWSPNVEASERSSKSGDERNKSFGHQVA